MPSLTMGAAPSGRPSGRNGGVWSSSSRKSANRYRSDDNRPSSDTRMLSLKLASPPQAPSAVPGATPGCQCSGTIGRWQAAKVEAERRILHIELLDLVVAH